MRVLPIAALAVLLFGCGPEPQSPPFISLDDAPIPASCKERGPAEPKLRVGVDADDIDAANDRVRLKKWGRAHVEHRRDCLEQLEAQRGK